MKKIFSLIAIAAVASTMFTSCSSKDETPTPTPKKAKLTLSGDKLTVAVAATGKFTIISDIAAPEAIVIEVKSSDATKLTVDPASVTIAKDKKTIEGTYTGVADGKAKITITTTSTVASVEKGEIEVTVGDAPAGNIVSGTIGFDCASMSEGENWAAIGDDNFGASVYYFDTDWTGTAGSATRISIDNYGGDVVGTKEAYGIVLTLVAKDTPIDDKLAWVKNADHLDTDLGWNGGAGWMCEPYLWVEGQYTSLVGKEGYVVVNFVSSYNTDTKTPGKQTRGWIQVSVKDGSVTIGDFAYIDGSGDFKVGQTK